MWAFGSLSICKRDLSCLTWKSRQAYTIVGEEEEQWEHIHV